MSNTDLEHELIEFAQENAISQQRIASIGSPEPVVPNEQAPKLPQELVNGGVAIATLTLVLMLIRALIALVKVSKED